MTEEIDFTDLAALITIGPDTVVEKFSSLINASFFDASNMLGTLKQKGLIDFSIQFPGQNRVEVTDTGKQLIAEADAKATTPLDQLDTGILTQLSGGKRTVAELGTGLNVRARDMAMHLYKLYKQQYLNYDFKNGKIDAMLTEKGFVEVKNRGMAQPAMQPMAPTGMPAAQPAMQQPMAAQGAVQEAPAQPKSVEEIEAAIRKAKRMRFTAVVVIAAVVVVLVVLLMLRYYLHIL